MLVVPFIGLLLCVAVCPLVCPEWWEKHQPLVVLFWILAFAIPSTIVDGVGSTLEEILECVIGDYITFIVLLFGLFCVAGNIALDGDLAGSPRTNVFMLAMGAILSSIIGTTGASMVMIRPMMKINSWREKKAHIMIFFIFLVSNIGGCLTPIGDPPLLMGFSRGVSFFWSLHLLPVFLMNLVVLLFIFYKMDMRAYQREIFQGAHPDISKPNTEIKLMGKHNVIFIVMIVGAVILSGVLPSLPLFQDANHNVLGITIFRDVKLTYPSMIEMAIILLAAFLSFRTTSKKIRKKNHFNWGAIQEVAVLFIGIFITMQPALEKMNVLGASMNLNEPAKVFWVTGALSSFLDNTPTYLVFLTTIASMGFQQGIQTSLGVVPQKMLMALSCGAVFMGANSYIGNAPNFMVKAIADENGIKMPSFFGYIGWSLAILIPVFLLDTLVFFLF